MGFLKAKLPFEENVIKVSKTDEWLDVINLPMYVLKKLGVIQVPMAQHFLFVDSVGC